MSTLGIIGSLVILGLGLAYLIYPMVVKPERLGSIAHTQKGRDELVVRYERVVSTMRDLDDDFATGKVNEQEYHEERAIWAKRGVELLKALEKAGVNLTEKPVTTRATNGQRADKAATPETTEADAEFDDAIEEAISKYVSAMSD